MSVSQLGQGTCPECSRPFARKNAAQMFCITEHQMAFHRRNAQRGRIAMPFVQAFRRGKRGRTEDTAYALDQLCKLADRWNGEDKAAKRRPDLIVTAKRVVGWTEADLDLRRRK